MKIVKDYGDFSSDEFFLLLNTKLTLFRFVLMLAPPVVFSRLSVRCFFHQLSLTDTFRFPFSDVTEQHLGNDSMGAELEKVSDFNFFFLTNEEKIILTSQTEELFNKAIVSVSLSPSWFNVL